MAHPLLLVICGDARRRASFVDALSRAGWATILSAPSMSEAIGLTRNDPNACMIVDAELEDVPGLKAAEILRKICPRAKVIFTAAQNTRDLEAQVRSLDVFYYYISSDDEAELVAAVASAIREPSASKTAHPPKVLIVDDDSGFHKTICAMLWSAGYETVSAYSESEGLEAARREKPDAILLDIIMQSSTDGFEFCHEAKRDPQIRHTPILGISAIEARIGLHCPPDLNGDLFPVDGYLKKPVAPQELLAELRKLIPAEE